MEQLDDLDNRYLNQSSITQKSEISENIKQQSINWKFKTPIVTWNSKRRFR
jgi:hypothetical protein